MNNGHQSDTYSINGHTIEVEWTELGNETIEAVEDYIRKDDFGAAKIILVGGVMDTLHRDGKLLVRGLTRAQRRSGERNFDNKSIPVDYDAKNQELPMDKMLKTLVARYPFLALREPLDIVFAKYKTEDAPEKDPTKSPAATKTES